jgi:thiamine biosynthesis lipoprotein ApbE
VADALTTAFMLMSVEEIAALVDRSPGLQAWILPEPDDGLSGQAALVRIGDSRPGYTAASS